MGLNHSGNFRTQKLIFFHEIKIKKNISRKFCLFISTDKIELAFFTFNKCGFQHFIGRNDKSLIKCHYSFHPSYKRKYEYDISFDIYMECTI